MFATSPGSAHPRPLPQFIRAMEQFPGRGSARRGHAVLQKKGCSRCHSVSGVGGGAAPDLGYSRSPQGGLGQIVSAMWNHGPRMSELMRKKGIAYPDLDNRDMANLFAFLYTARYVDEPGDARRGESGCSWPKVARAATAPTGRPAPSGRTSPRWEVRPSKVHARKLSCRKSIGTAPSTHDPRLLRSPVCVGACLSYSTLRRAGIYNSSQSRLMYTLLGR